MRLAGYLMGARQRAGSIYPLGYTRDQFFSDMAASGRKSGLAEGNVLKEMSYHEQAGLCSLRAVINSGISAEDMRRGEDIYYDASVEAGVFMHRLNSEKKRAIDRYMKSPL